MYNKKILLLAISCVALFESRAENNKVSTALQRKCDETGLRYRLLLLTQLPKTNPYRKRGLKTYGDLNRHLIIREKRRKRDEAMAEINALNERRQPGGDLYSALY